MAGPGAAAAPRPAVETNVYLAVGGAGVVLFLVGILPKVVLSHLPIPALALGYVELLVAASGGALAMFGFSRWYDRRKADREPTDRPEDVESTRRRLGSSFEVYDPNADDPARRRRSNRP
ncbi:MAG TPA: hypothetical protein VFF67_05490 [Thermoplasmata archaeon]|nr:hypothetical protein [Thermoplasmata archaeon]